MSDSGNSDELLDQYLKPDPRKDKRRDSRPNPKPAASGEHGGLNPMDMLDLPNEQRDVVNWLSRRKQATFDELREALDMEPAVLTQVLAALREAGHVKEALVAGDILYRVVFGGRVSRVGRGLPEGIWERVDLDNTVFLREVPLFHGMPEDDLREFALKLDARQYRRDEVILWQGGLGDGVYLIKSGVVGITRLIPGRRDTQILAYLKQGDLLGEYGLLFEQNSAASATATALSDVEVLVMRRQHMLALLKNYPSVAIAMVQLLAQRLLAIEAQSARQHGESSLCLVIGVEPKSGCTTIGSSLASALAHATQNSTVYTEHPAPGLLPAQFDFTAQAETYQHPGGFDVLVPQGVSGVPLAVRTTLIMDRLMSSYTNLVIGVSGDIDETTIYMLERADQVILVVPPTATAIENFKTFHTRLKAAIRPEKTSLSIICNHTQDFDGDFIAPAEIDHEIAKLEQLPPLSELTGDNLPPELQEVIATLARHLGRTNQIGVYIPATIEGETSIDPQSFVDRTLLFFKAQFGSAGGYPAHTITQTERRAGLVGENIHIVQTFVTKSDMDRHLGAVLTFVEQLKTDLNQEAMALEINHNIMLV